MSIHPYHARDHPSGVFLYPKSISNILFQSFKEDKQHEENA